MKKVVFPLFSAFLIHQSYGSLRTVLLADPGSLNIGVSVVLALLIALYITGVFAFVGFAYPTSSLLPESYYRINAPRSLKAIAKWMGLRYFQMALLAAYWGRPKNRMRYFDGTKSGLQNFIYQTKQSEFGHLGAFVVLLVVSIGSLVIGHSYVFAVTMLINILGNFYPLILQRLHRMRIQRVS